MKLSPRYDGPPLLRLEGVTDDPAVPLLRQRRRLGTLLASLDADQWDAASRCEAWSVRDVVVHLTTTNQFFAVSIGSGLAGSPTRFLEGFDPVATPAQLVDERRGTTPSEALAAYDASVESLADVATGLDAAAWGVPAEAPPGLLSARCVALHALWDAWVHERDIAVPLGLEQVQEPDELRGCLLYAAALGPTFLALHGDDRPGTIVIHATEPTTGVLVELGPSVRVSEVAVGDALPDGAVQLEGRCADLIESLSFRTPPTTAVPADQAWMFNGLAAVFDLV